MEIQTIRIVEIKSEEHAQRIETNEEKMSEIVASIQKDGLLQPLTVRKDEEGFTLVFGHRRLEACKRSGWTEVPCIVAQGDDAKIAGITFAENFFRDDLTSFELAVAIAEEFKSERMTLDQLAVGFKRSVDWVRKQIAICGWPPDVLDALHNSGLSVAAASNLACITEDAYRETLVSQAVDNGATARTTSAWLQAWRSMMPLEQTIEQQPDPSYPQQQPLVPQAPCLACHDVFRTDELSHVPLCSKCIRIISNAQQQAMPDMVPADLR